jgi:hypothetical protein
MVRKQLSDSSRISLLIPRIWSIQPSGAPNHSRTRVIQVQDTKANTLKQNTLFIINELEIISLTLRPKKLIRFYEIIAVQIQFT